MSTIISLFSQKGGVGKSTCTILLANCLHYHYKKKVALVDADFPQNSIAKRRDKELRLLQQNDRLKTVFDKVNQDRPPYPIIKTNLLSCPTEIEKLKGEYDYIFVDITGSINQEGIIDFFKCINFFFIPLLQDDFSLISSMELYGIITQKIKPISKEYRTCQLFFNRVPAMSRVAAIKKQMSAKIDFMEEDISAYTIYERAYRSTVFPIPKDKKESIKLLRFVKCFSEVLTQYQAIPMTV